MGSPNMPASHQDQLQQSNDPLHPAQRAFYYNPTKLWLLRPRTTFARGSTTGLPLRKRHLLSYNSLVQQMIQRVTFFPHSLLTDHREGTFLRCVRSKIKSLWKVITCLTPKKWASHRSHALVMRAPTHLRLLSRRMSSLRIICRTLTLSTIPTPVMPVILLPLTIQTYNSFLSYLSQIPLSSQLSRQFLQVMILSVMLGEIFSPTSTFRSFSPRLSSTHSTVRSQPLQKHSLRRSFRIKA
jgi:hypothetical protein